MKRAMLPVHLLALSGFMLLAHLTTQPVGASETPEKTSQIIETINDRLRSVAERKQAIDQARKDSKPKELIASLLQIAKNAREPILLRSYAIQTLTQMKNPETAVGLKTILDDSSLDVQTRKMAMYALWQKNPAETKAELARIARDRKEVAALRILAIQCLQKNSQDIDAQFWIRLLEDPYNPGDFRTAILNIMEGLGIFDQQPEILAHTLHNIQDPLPMRKLATIIMSKNMPTNTLVQELLSILKNPDDKMEMRQFALANIGALDPSIIPLTELKIVQAKEKNASLAREIHELIQQIESTALSV